MQRGGHTQLVPQVSVSEGEQQGPVHRRGIKSRTVPDTRNRGLVCDASEWEGERTRAHWQQGLLKGQPVH